MAEGIIRRMDLIEDDAFFWPREYAKMLEEAIAKSKQLGGKGSTTKKDVDELAKVQKSLSVATQQSTKEYIQQKAALDKLRTSNRNAVKDINTQAGAYNSLSRRLDEVRNKYKNLAAQGKENTREAKNFRLEAQKLDAQLKKIDNSVGQNQRSVGKYTDALKGLGTRLLGLIGAGYAFIRMMQSAVRIVLDYGKANSTLNAILGKTSAETEKLRKQQQELGKATAFSATQVTKAQTELARLGLTMSEIIDLTPAILNAAVALGVDMADAAELVAGQLNAFNLEAKEGQRVADVLVRATQISAFNYERLATSLAIVSPAAKAAGASIEDTVGIMTAAVDANIDASSAATALRNIFIELSDKGLTWDQAMNKIRNSTDKLKAANDLFGKRGAVVGLVIAENTKKIDENTKALNNAAGAADKFAKEQLDNLRGDITLLTSAWEGFILSLEQGDGIIAKVARTIIQTLTGALNGLMNISHSLEMTFQSVSNWSDETIEAILKSETVFANSGKKIKDIATEVVEGVAPKTIVENIQFFQKEFAKALIKNGESIENASHFAEAWGRITLKNIDLTEENTQQIIEETQEVEKLIKALRDLTSIDAFKDQRSEFKKNAEERAAFLDARRRQEKKLGQDIKTINNEIVKSDEAAAKERERIAKESEKIRNDLIQEGLQSSAEIVGNFANFRIEQINNQLTALEFARDRELEKVGDNERAKFQINKEFDQKRKQLQRKQANIEKANNLFQIGINTAAGITKTLAQLGLPAAIPFIALAAGIGLAQAAAVIAAPVPEFAEGTEKTPSEFIAGEKGRELRIDPRGKASLVERRTHFKGKQYEGSAIIPNKETDSILGSIADLTGHNLLTEKRAILNLLNDDFKLEKKQEANLAFILKRNNDELINTIKNKKETSIYVNGSSHKVVEKSGNTYVNRIDHYYKR